MESDPFISFWQAGYEGADHVNGRGMALDMAGATHHERLAAQDFDGLAAFGMCSVRETLGWRKCEVDGRFDFSAAIAIAQAAQSRGIQVLWTLCHYGIPDDVSFSQPDFI